MSVDLAVDTNILAYAEGIDDAVRYAVARGITDRLLPDSTFVPVQALGELYTVLVRKGRFERQSALEVILRWRRTFQVVETSDSVFRAAVRLATDHGLQIWDAIILSAAADARCSLLLSEDMQDGFVWRGVTVVNPFAAPQHPLLVSALEGR